MKQTGMSASMIILLFAVNYFIVWFIPQKPMWLDFTVHCGGGLFAALYTASFMDWRARGFGESGSFFRFIVVVCGAITLGVFVELFEALDANYKWLILVKKEQLYWNTIYDLTANFVGAVWGALIYLAWNDIKQ